VTSAAYTIGGGTVGYTDDKPAWRDLRICARRSPSARRQQEHQSVITVNGSTPSQTAGTLYTGPFTLSTAPPRSKPCLRKRLDRQRGGLGKHTILRARQRTCIGVCTLLPANPAIDEIQMFDIDGNSLVSAAPLLRLVATEAGGGDYGPGKAIDGNFTTFWTVVVCQTGGNTSSPCGGRCCPADSTTTGGGGGAARPALRCNTPMTAGVGRTQVLLFRCLLDWLWRLSWLGICRCLRRPREPT